MSAVGSWSHWCQKNRLGMALLTLFYIPSAFATPSRTSSSQSEESSTGISFNDLKLGWTIESFSPYYPRRGPLSYVPPEEAVTVPVRQENSMVTNIFAPDESGVMDETVKQMQEWDRQEQYAKQWNLEDSGLYTPVTVEQRKEYILGRSIKYLDKRLQGETKRAKPGSTLATVGQVQSALKPTTEVGIAEKIKLKFKAQMLEGDARVTLENPMVDTYTEVQTNQDVTSGTAPSKVESANMHVGKSFKDLGLDTGVDYQVMDGSYVASSTKQITGGLKSRISTGQPRMGQYETSAEHKVELLFDTAF